VESLIGAVFLDSGGCLLTSWRAIQSLFKIDLRELVKSTQPSPVKKVLEKFPEKITFEKRLPKKVSILAKSKALEMKTLHLAFRENQFVVLS